MSDEREPDYATAEETPGLHRQREAHHATPPRWKQPNVVETVPCMVPSCRKPVEITDEAMSALITFSKHLRARGEEPLDMGKTFNCPECAKEREADALERTGCRRAKTTLMVRRLKGVEKCTRDEERAAVEWLEKVMGKGYVVDLQRCIEEKRSGKRTRTREQDL